MAHENIKDVAANDAAVFSCFLSTFLGLMTFFLVAIPLIDPKNFGREKCDSTEARFCPSVAILFSKLFAEKVGVKIWADV